MKEKNPSSLGWKVEGKRKVGGNKKLFIFYCRIFMFQMDISPFSTAVFHILPKKGREKKRAEKRQRRDYK
jgi:hypothetical protein